MRLLRISRLSPVLLALGSVLFLVGCGVVESTPTAKPTAVPTLRPTATPVPQPLDLVVVHTNDVLGYTEPCG
ncbi:MAG TPA: hypothetical protein VMY98_02770 [Anaerolineae bacterium]|nr:hypothetical protein [Anaerolineae bacterium]